MSPRARVLLTTVLLAVVAAGYVAVERRAARPGPVLPRPTDVITRPAPLAPDLPAGAVLARRDALNLTREQVSRLESLASAWAQESAGIEAAVADAQARFTRFADRTQGARGATVSALQRESADYRELSAGLREARRRHADAAAAILTEAQRRRLALSSSPQLSGEQR